MHYDKANERAPVSPIRPVGGTDYRQNSDIRRTRVILLILLVIQTVRADFSSNLEFIIPFFLDFQYILSRSTICRFGQIQS